MQDIHNGICAAELVGATWKKSQRSNSQGAALVYPAHAVRALVSAVRTGEFDYLVS